MAAMVEEGTVVGHRVYMEFDFGKLYMTPRGFAVATSSRAKKSTGLLYPSMDIVVSISNQFLHPTNIQPSPATPNPFNVTVPFTILSTSATPEGFFDSLCDACPVGKPRRCVVHFQDEWSRWFAEEESKRYMSGSIEAYVVACDGRPESRKLSGKTEKSHGELSLIALHTAVQESYEKVEQPWHFTSGLIPRHFVRIGKVKKYYPPALKNPNPVVSIDFVDKLKAFAEYYDQYDIHTVCSWSPEAQKAFDRWCIRNDKLGEKEDTAVQVIHSRAENLFCIMAMAYAISENVYRPNCPPTITMDLAHFKKIAKHIKPYIDDAIELYGGCGQRHIKAVRRILVRLGGIKVPLWAVSKQFTNSDFGDGDDFERALRSLVEQEEIIVDETPNMLGRPGRIISIITDISEKVKK